MHIVLLLCNCKLQLSSETNGWWLMNVTEISFVRQQEESGPKLCIACQSACCCQYNGQFNISSNDWKPMKKISTAFSCHCVYVSWDWGRFVTMQRHHHPAGYSRGNKSCLFNLWEHKHIRKSKACSCSLLLITLLVNVLCVHLLNFVSISVRWSCLEVESWQLDVFLVSFLVSVVALKLHILVIW